MIKSKLEAIKNFLVFVCGKHWAKIVALIILIILGVLLWTKDCTIKTNKVEIHTDTHLDAAKDKVDKAPSDIPAHR
jgi:hypothetical protein